MENLKKEIFNLVQTGNQAFTTITPQLHSEIPIILYEMQLHIENDDFFATILNKVTNRWGNLYTKNMKNNVNMYMFEHAKLKEVEREIIQYAENLPIVKLKKSEELDDLNDKISVMFNPTGELISGFKHAKISKRKLPSKRKK
jgi:hypothetical protein